MPRNEDPKRQLSSGDVYAILTNREVVRQRERAVGSGDGKFGESKHIRERMGNEGYSVRFCSCRPTPAVSPSPLVKIVLPFLVRERGIPSPLPQSQGQLHGRPLQVV